MKVVEIFSSIEGEGIRSGKLVTFIRLGGCNLRCSYCDTTYSYDIQQCSDMTIPQIIATAREAGNELVTITGGEPLIHDDIQELIDQLIDEDFKVNIETNGSVSIRPFYRSIKNEKYVPPDNLIFTLDWKSPSSNMNNKMLVDNLYALDYEDVLKFVVGSSEDLNEMLRVLQAYEFNCSNIFISPVFGQIDMKDIVDFMKLHDLQNCRLQVQLHKIIWPVDMRGV